MVNEQMYLIVEFSLYDRTTLTKYCHWNYVAPIETALAYSCKFNMSGQPQHRQKGNRTKVTSSLQSSVVRTIKAGGLSIVVRIAVVSIVWGYNQHRQIHCHALSTHSWNFTSFKLLMLKVLTTKTHRLSPSGDRMIKLCLPIRYHHWIFSRKPKLAVSPYAGDLPWYSARSESLLVYSFLAVLIAEAGAICVQTHYIYWRTYSLMTW